MNNGERPLKKIEYDDVPTVEIVDDYDYISRTKVIAKIHITGAHGEIKRKGKFLRTKNGGYMFG